MQSSIKKNTVFNMIKTLAGIIFPLITFPYISRVLQPENVGRINFGSSIVNYFTLAATLGVTTYAVRECSTKKNNQKQFEQTASEIISINFITMLVSYTALIICLIFVPKFVDYRLLITIQSMAIFFTVIGADWLNTTMEDFRYITIRTVTFQFVSLVLMFLFVKKPSDYIVYAIISLGASSAGNLCNVFYRRRYGKIRLVRQMNWKKHFPPIIGLFALMLSQTIMNSIDQTMIGFMMGDYDVGLYSVAYKVISIVTQVVASITWVVLPQLSGAFDDSDYPTINRILNKTLNFTYTLTIPCVVGLVILSKEVLLIVGGDNYLAAAPCLIILSVGLVADLIWSNLWGNCVLLPARREKQFTVACFVAMIANVIGDYLLIPIFGIAGTAFATVVAKVIIGIISMINKDNYVQMGFSLKLIGGPLVGALAIAVICMGIKLLGFGIALTTILSITFSVIVYGVIMILFKNEVVMEYLGSLKVKFAKFKG